MFFKDGGAIGKAGLGSNRSSTASIDNFLQNPKIFGIDQAQPEMGGPPITAYQMIHRKVMLIQKIEIGAAMKAYFAFFLARSASVWCREVFHHT